jgi:SAM-dependent methyltransferase
MMLDSIRVEALRPADLVAQLALPPTAVVADVGAGPGFFTLPLSRAVPNGEVIATDLHADYLLVTLARAAADGDQNVKAQLVGADDPGLHPASIDLAFLCQVDHALHDRAAYFARLVPALRPGGRIALVNYVRYHDADVAAARAVGLHIVSEWQPSPPFFLLVLAPGSS